MRYVVRLGVCLALKPAFKDIVPWGFSHSPQRQTEAGPFLVVYVFTQHATAGQAPIEVIQPEARRMPLYRLISDSLRALQERGHVKAKPQIADLLLKKAAAA
jgi:hypothetical protein